MAVPPGEFERVRHGLIPFSPISLPAMKRRSTARYGHERWPTARRWAWLGTSGSLQRAERALAIAREVDDPALLARALTSYGLIAGYSSASGPEAQACFEEAGRIARELGDFWRLSQIYAWQAYAAISAGDAVRRGPRPSRDAISPTQSAMRSNSCGSVGWESDGDSPWLLTSSGATAHSARNSCRVGGRARPVYGSLPVRTVSARICLGPGEGSTSLWWLRLRRSPPRPMSLGPCRESATLR